MAWQDIALRMRTEGPGGVPLTDCGSVAVSERGTAESMYGIAGFHRRYGLIC